MISNKALISFGNGINLSYAFGFTPFRFELQNYRLFIPKRGFHLIIYFTNGACQLLKFAYTLFQLVSISLHHHEGSTEYSETFWLITFTLSEFWALSFLISVWIHRRNIASFFNRMVDHASCLTKGNKSKTQHCKSFLI
jgi:hypothetical protein